MGLSCGLGSSSSGTFLSAAEGFILDEVWHISVKHCADSDPLDGNSPAARKRAANDEHRKRVGMRCEPFLIYTVKNCLSHPPTPCADGDLPRA